MKKNRKLVKQRAKGLLLLLFSLVLVLCLIRTPEVAHAATNVFPNLDGGITRVYDTGGQENTETPPSKPGGHVSVTMDDFYYGGTGVPQVVSETGDAKEVVLTYKVSGADDSTYTSQMPTEVGTYTVLAFLPGDNYYGAAFATDTFTISYLKAPSPAYELEGILGENGWYTSDVVIRPPQGYELSVGNRNAFQTEGYVVSKETNGLNLYLRKAATGEMTDVISIANIRIDKEAPILSNVDAKEVYYADSLEVCFEEKYFDTVTVNGETVTAEKSADGKYSFSLEAGIKRLACDIVITDKAGNETKVTVTIAPAWLEDGIVGEGEYYLETGEAYSFPQNSQWQKAGDATVYAPGVSFYAEKEGSVTFTRK